MRMGTLRLLCCTQKMPISVIIFLVQCTSVTVFNFKKMDLVENVHQCNNIFCTMYRCHHTQFLKALLNEGRLKVEGGKLVKTHFMTYLPSTLIMQFSKNEINQLSAIFSNRAGQIFIQSKFPTFLSVFRPKYLQFSPSMHSFMSALPRTVSRAPLPCARHNLIIQSSALYFVTTAPVVQPPHR